MKHLLVVLMFVSVFCFGEKTPVQFAARVEEAVMAEDGMERLKSLTDQAMNGAIERGVEELKKKKRYDLADRIYFEWYALFGGSVWNMRGIGDHAGLSRWITDTYRSIEAVIGKETAISTHIATMLTLNHAIPVVFNPCAFPMDSVPGDRIDEYRRHFAKDDMNDYHGLSMEVTYWAAVIGFSSMGWPGGGLVGKAAEGIMGTFVAPHLSNYVYKRACGGTL